MDEWQLVELDLDTKLGINRLNLTVENTEDYTIDAVFDKTDNENITIYFSAPSDYIGKKLTTYGGFLNYTLYYTITPGEGQL